MDPQLNNKGLTKEGHGYAVQAPVTIQCTDAGGGLGYIPPIPASGTPRVLGAVQSSPLSASPDRIVPPAGAIMLIVVTGQPLLYCVGDPNFGAYTKAPAGVIRIPCSLSDRNGSVDTAIYFEQDDAPIFPQPDTDDPDSDQFAFSFEMLAP